MVNRIFVRKTMLHAAIFFLNISLNWSFKKSLQTQMASIMLWTNHSGMFLKDFIYLFFFSFLSLKVMSYPDLYILYSTMFWGKEEEEKNISCVIKLWILLIFIKFLWLLRKKLMFKKNASCLAFRWSHTHWFRNCPIMFETNLFILRINPAICMIKLKQFCWTDCFGWIYIGKVLSPPITT